jgi:hypothetical protein
MCSVVFLYFSHSRLIHFLLSVPRVQLWAWGTGWVVGPSALVFKGSGITQNGHSHPLFRQPKLNWCPCRCGGKRRQPDASISPSRTTLWRNATGPMSLWLCCFWLTFRSRYWAVVGRTLTSQKLLSLSWVSPPSTVYVGVPLLLGDSAEYYSLPWKARSIL